MPKKLPHELDTNDLLALIEQNQPVLVELKDTDTPEIIEDHEKHGDVLSFLSQFNIIGGTNPIRKNLLYSIYKAWSVGPLKRKDFISSCNELLVNGQFNTYLINQNAIKLTYDAYVKFKKHFSVIKSQKFAVQFQDYLNHYSITGGEYWIHVNILFFLYDKFTNEKKYQRSLKLQFFDQFCKLHLKLKVTSKGKMYAVSPNIEGFFQPGQLDRMKVTYAHKEKQEKEVKARKRKRKTKSKSKGK